MHKEIVIASVEDHKELMNYNEIFKIFVLNRKVKLIRYLFNYDIEFAFSVNLFKDTLNQEGYDIAVLLHNEFRYLMRGNST
jgi:hypothetical protein